MRFSKYWAVMICVGLLVIGANSACAVEVNKLLDTGKAAIENGEYEKAVDCLGKLLEASGNKTSDPKIVSLGSTVQAYGIWKMNNPQMKPMVVRYLEKAITADPTWKYPEKLLKEVEGKN